jgi:glycosyltransferase involved in cell wall biosynthesis
MRIAVVNWTTRQVGGAEKYLATVLPELHARGHQLALLAEMDLPEDRDAIPLGPDVPVWPVSTLGREGALRSLRAWNPDLVFTHITLEPDVEAAAQGVAPAVLFTHAYYGTCVSGTKTHQAPGTTPCERAFGAACLIHFYPRRCGGLNPATMVRDYRRQRRRNDLLAGYRSIVTNSEHMRREYLRNGVEADRVKAIRMPVAGTRAAIAPRPHLESGERILLFAGRMDPLKGGAVLLDALPDVQRRLGAPLRLVLVGDGPERERWMARAERVRATSPEIAIDFPGWLEPGDLTGWFARADLLVVPSLWPEPFGLVGPEAGLYGLPAAAFPVGGIPEWLADGENGHLATGGENGASQLAEAIARCLSDPRHHAALREGAWRLARRFDLAHHVTALVEVLETAASADPIRSPGLH